MAPYFICWRRRCHRQRFREQIKAPVHELVKTTTSIAKFAIHKKKHQKNPCWWLKNMLVKNTEWCVNFTLCNAIKICTAIWLHFNWILFQFGWNRHIYHSIECHSKKCNKKNTTNTSLVRIHAAFRHSCGILSVQCKSVGFFYSLRLCVGLVLMVSTSTQLWVHMYFAF